MTDSWQPSASLENLKRRANILHSIRDFFSKRNVLEVETPLLCKYTVTDVHMDSIRLNYQSTAHYLQTSPEYAMKRLLAAGSGDIFQLCKAFRQDEQGRMHQPEFTMLEWYRVDWDHHQLMDEVDALLQQTLSTTQAQRLTYLETFEQHFGIDPHRAPLNELTALADKHGLLDALGETHDNRDDWLMLLMSHVIEPKLGSDAPCFIYDYPETQAALAKKKNGVAERFEVYFKGIELANGFHELQNADEQLARFQHDLSTRKELAKPAVDIDQQLIAALKHGLPNCAGVALGVDRLVMLALGETDIAKVLSFT